LFLFDGEMLTMKQIHARVPVMSPQHLKKHIDAGRNTKQAILHYRHVAKRAPNTPWVKGVA
jgi:hypothetical protein